MQCFDVMSKNKNRKKEKEDEEEGRKRRKRGRKKERKKKKKKRPSYGAQPVSKLTFSRARGYLVPILPNRANFASPKPPRPQLHHVSFAVIKRQNSSKLKRRERVAGDILVAIIQSINIRIEKLITVAHEN